jgi:hypothetical protein
MIQLFIHLLAQCPWVIEVFVTDRKGDPHNGPQGFIIRCCLIAVFSLAAAFLHDDEIKLALIKCISLSTGYFIIFFAQAVNWNLHRRGITENKDWWNNLNPATWPDSWKIYNVWPWQIRQIILFVIGASIIVGVYFEWLWTY